MLTAVVDEVAGDLRRRGQEVPSALRHPVSAVHLCSRWEGRHVYAVFGRHDRRPSLVLKVDHNPAYQRRLHTEFDALTELTRHPAVQGRVPRPVGLVEGRARHVLVQTAVDGVQLNVLLRRRMRTSERIVRRDHRLVLSWLDRLHRRPGAEPGWTSMDAPAALDGVERALAELPAPADALHRLIASQADALAGLQLPVLPGHGDLGPSNCLITRNGDVNVIDWEGGVGHRVPLTDVLIFLNHYARGTPGAGHQLPSRADAFRRAFCHDGALARATAASWMGALHRLGLPAASSGALFLCTLVDLACGKAPSAHATRQNSRRYWSEMLSLYAAGHTRSLIARSIG